MDEDKTKKAAADEAAAVKAKADAEAKASAEAKSKVTHILHMRDTSGKHVEVEHTASSPKNAHETGNDVAREKGLTFIRAEPVSEVGERKATQAKLEEIRAFHSKNAARSKAAPAAAMAILLLFWATLGSVLGQQDPRTLVTGTILTTNISVTSGGANILAANTKRSYVRILKQGSTDVGIYFGNVTNSTGSVTNPIVTYGLVLTTSNAVFEMKGAGLFNGTISAISGSGNTNPLAIIEGSYR